MKEMKYLMIMPLDLQAQSTNQMTQTALFAWLKNLPATQETGFGSLDRVDSLEKGMATHPSYSCLENFMDRGAWQAIVHRVAKTQTQLNN